MTLQQAIRNIQELQAVVVSQEKRLTQIEALLPQMAAGIEAVNVSISGFDANIQEVAKGLQALTEEKSKP